MSPSDGVPRHRHAAFGLVVDSALPLPELPAAPGDAEPDVTLRYGAVPGGAPDPATGPTVSFDDASEFTLVYTACRVRVRNGDTLVVDRRPGATDREVRWVVLGPALNFLLHQRGYLILHASTVAVDGAAVAFVGASGAGKSTTAAAFVAAGHRALGDDVAAVRLTDHGPVVRPGFASLKLDAGAADRLAGGLVPVTDGGPDDEATAVVDGGDAPAAGERFYRADDGAPPDARELPLAAVYRVVDGDEVSLTPFPPAVAAVELARNTYTVGTQGRRDEASLAIDRSAAVAAAVPVATLARPREFAALPAVVDAVADAVAGRSGPGVAP
jgi:hypothetical protein